MKSILALFIVLVLIMPCPCLAIDYFVSTNSGNDNNPGTIQKPFQTIQKAANIMKAGDTCIVRAGTYRETIKVRKSGEPGKPIRFIAAQGEKVIIDGTESVKGKWKVYRDRIYQIDLDGQQITQLFVNHKMMPEARWPNCNIEEIWNRDHWAHAVMGSRKDLMISRELSGTNIDWTGAVAILNIGPQYNTFARSVLKHSKGNDSFQYNLNRRMYDGPDSGRSWADDRFYLFGKLEALDSPGEWFHDLKNKKLYLRCEDEQAPEKHRVEIKKRGLGFDIQKCQYVELQGFHFFSTTFSLKSCHHCVIENCRLLFPTFSRMLKAQSPAVETSVNGNHNIIRRVSIRFSNTHGLSVRGDHNLIENCIVHDVNWVGAFSYAGISMIGSRKEVAVDEETLNNNQNILRHCTIYNVGNVGIFFARGKHIIEYNNVYNTGLACHDIAAIHTGSPLSSGSVVHHNWVHESTGLGIRGDDQSRQLTFHHNAIWNCRRGLIMKGNHNKCFNNTVLIDPDLPQAIGSIVIPKAAEPDKWWTKYKRLQIQNVDSLIFNNASYLIGARKNREVPLPPSNNIFANITLPKNLSSVFVNANSKALLDGSFDLRPKTGSILIDAGKKISGVTGPYLGKSPDVGAYEAGGKKWRAGADWQPGNVPWKMRIKLEK